MGSLPLVFSSGSASGANAYLVVVGGGSAPAAHLVKAGGGPG